MSSIEVLCAAVWVLISGLVLTPMSQGVSLHNSWKWHGVQKQGQPATNPFSESSWDCCLPHPSFIRWNTPLEKPSGNNIYPSPLLTFHGQRTKNKQQSQTWMLCHCITEPAFPLAACQEPKISSNTCIRWHPTHSPLSWLRTCVCACVWMKKGLTMCLLMCSGWTCIQPIRAWWGSCIERKKWELPLLCH